LWQYRACRSPGTTRSRHHFIPKEIYFAMSEIHRFSLLNCGFEHERTEILTFFTCGIRKVVILLLLPFSVRSQNQSQLLRDEAGATPGKPVTHHASGGWGRSRLMPGLGRVLFPVSQFVDQGLW
jgi:hypothetical protein